MTNEYEFLKIITAQLCTSQYTWISQFMLSCIYICGNYLEITLLILGLLLSCCKFRSFPCSVIVDNVRSAMYFINYFLLWSQVISQIFSLKQLLLGPATPFFSSVTHVILLDSEYRIPSLFINSKIVIFFKRSAAQCHSFCTPKVQGISREFQLPPTSLQSSSLLCSCILHQKEKPLMSINLIKCKHKNCWCQ